MKNKTTTPSPLLVVGLDRKVRGGTMEWKPIDTAPKTEEQILTFRHYLAGAIIGGKERDWFQTSFWSVKYKLYVGWPLNIQPTHWMPLPKAPNVELRGAPPIGGASPRT